MKVVLCLKSRVIGEAIRDLLTRDDPVDRFFLDGDDSTPFTSVPDLVVTDRQSLSAELFRRWPQAKVILLDTGLPQEELINAILLYRLPGVISTEDDVALIRKALRLVHGGQVWINHRDVKALLCRAGSIVGENRMEPVSKREQEIIKHLSLGKRNREIAEELFMSEHTVKAHMSRIFKKFHVSSRAELVTSLFNSSRKDQNAT